MRDNIKKFLGLFLCTVLALGGFSNVFASSNVLHISSVEITSKSAGVEAETPSIENDHVQGDVVFNAQGDHIEYLFAIENTDDYAYRIDSITDNNSTEKLAITYSHGEKIEAKSTVSFTMLMEYSEQLVNQEKLDLSDLQIKIRFTRIGGSEDEEKEEDIDVNPDTESSSVTNVVANGALASSAVILVIVFALHGTLPKQLRYAGIGTALLLAGSAISLNIASAAQSEEIDVWFSNIELVGIFENYTVTIDTGNGPVEHHYDYGTPLSEILSRPSKTGYHFDKWVDGDGNTIDENGTITGPIDIVAVMEANKYHVVFDANGGTGSMDSQEFTYDEAAKKLSKNTFERPGYNFAGWATTAIGRAKAYDDEEEVRNLVDTTEDVNLYATWTKLTDIAYTVKHRYADLTGGYDEVEREEAGPVDEDVYPPVLERDGFNDPATIAPIRINPDGSTVVVLEYSRKSYAFAYGDSEYIDTNESTSAGDYAFETPITAKAKNRDGYQFTGWSDGSNIVSTNNPYTFDLPLDGITLTPTYEANTYHVAFHANGGTGDMAKQEFTFDDESKALSKNLFERPGYSFAGWATSADDEVVYADKAEVRNLTDGTEDVDLYAKWTANTYSVVFHANEGTGSMDDQTFAYDEAPKALAKNTFERVGYSFAGWAKTAAGEVEYTDEQEVQNLIQTAGTVDLYAKWTANTYYAHFHANGGDGSMDDQSFTYGEAAKALAANTFTRAGYSFAGWATTAGGEVEYADGASVQNLTSDIDLYAKWTANTYRVIFHSNDGNDSTESQEFVFDEAAKALRANSFSREGYSFAGWAESASGEVVYTDEAQVQNLTTTTNDVDLYAKWTANTYYVTFHANNGAGSMENQPFTYGEAAKALMANAFTCTGYSFAGWAESDSGEVVYADEAQVQNLTSDIDLYAKWVANTYTVVFHSNEGSGLTESQEFTYDEGPKALRKNTFTYAGYSFAGWAESASGQVVYDDEEEIENLVETTEDVNLYAKWEARTDIPYLVIHHYEKLIEGYDDVEDPREDGRVDQDVQLPIQHVDGFVDPAIRTVPIAADGTTVEHYYYLRERVGFTLNDPDNHVTTETGTGEYKYGATISLVAEDVPGYGFTGWSDGQSIVSTNASYSFEITTDVTLTPSYVANTYNVIFNANGGIGSMDAQAFTYDAQATALTANTFTRAGYIFAGWATNPNGEIVYRDEQQVQNLTTTTDDFNLYAKWALRTDIKYTVHHRYENVGSGFTEVNTTEYGSVDTDITPPTAPEAGFGDPVADASTPVPTHISANGTSEVIYNYYRLYKNLTIVDGADVSGATSGSYKYGTQFELTAANRQGYEFAGWTIDGGESIISTNKTYGFVLTDNVTIQPVYDEAQFYDVFRHDGACVFDGNGNVTGDDCGDNPGYINTNVKLYDAANYEGDYEIGFTIDALGSTQVNQATIVNSKLESNSANYPGVAARKVSNGNDIEITQRINGGNPGGSPTNKTAWAAPKTIKIIRYKNVVYTQVGNETPKRLQSMAGTSNYHDIPVWFGATYVPPSGGNEGYADRLFNGTLSHMYIKQGEYDGATVTMTFDMNGDTGTAPDPISVLSGTAIATLPDEVDSGSDQVFMGWYRDKDIWLDRVTKNDALTQDVTVYARWASSADVCLVKDVVGQNDEISDVTKTKLKDCVDIINNNADMPSGEIVILHDINPATEAGGNNDIRISSGKDITITGDGYRLTANSSQPIFRNDRGGTLRLDNIKMNTKAGQAIVNNEAYNGISSNLYVNSCEFNVGDNSSKGTVKQAIYNVGSAVEITGNTVIESYSTIRAAITSDGGSVHIKSATVTAHNISTIVVSNNASITIGVDDGTVRNDSPIIISDKNYAVSGRVGINFYDGTLIAKGSNSNHSPLDNGSTTTATVADYPAGTVPMTTPWTTDYDNTYYWLYYGTSSGP